MVATQEVIETEYNITQVDPNITLYDGVANIETVIAKFVVPDSTWFVFRPDDVFGLYLATSVPAELEAGAIVRLIRADPNEVQRVLEVIATYEQLKEMVDRLKVYKLGKTFKLEPKQLLLVTVKSASAADDAQTRLRISCARITKPLAI